MKIRMLAFAVLPLLLSCGSGGGVTGPGPRSDRAAEILEATQAHGERIAAMTDMSGVPGEESDYAKVMDSMMDTLETDMDDMYPGCADEAEHMHEWMKDVEAECFHHDVDMLAAGSIDVAHAEEARHQARMADMADAMDGVMQHMMEDCSPHGMM